MIPPRNVAAIEAWSAHIWNDAPNRRAKYDGRDAFEPDIDDGYDYGNEGADRLEARETAAREWQA